MKTVSPVVALLAVLVLSGCPQVSDPQTELEKAVKDLQKRLPWKVDEYTTCKEIRAGDLEIIYVYEVSGIADSNIKSNAATLKQGVAQGLKANIGSLRPYVKHDIAMKYVYKNKKGEELVSFTLHPAKL